MRESILIIGGAGYIGSVTAHYIASQNYTIIILDSLIYKQNYNHLTPWATIITGDYGNIELLSKIFASYNIAAVFHFASLIEVGRSVKDPALFYQNNLIKTLTLLDTMKQYHVNKIVFSSSCSVYGVPENIPITEETQFNPVSPYGKTKAAIEYILEDYSKAYDLLYVSLRYFNASGALPEYNLGEFHYPETHIIPLLLRSIYLDKKFKIFGVDYNTPDATAVREIGRAHV